MAIALVSFMESMAVAKSIQSKHKDYELISNQELIALGLANVGGSFLQSYPVTGGFSRTAVDCVDLTISHAFILLSTSNHLSFCDYGRCVWFD